MSDLVKIFEDTRKQCKSNKVLIDSVKSSLSAQRLVMESENLPDMDENHHAGKVYVTKNRTMQAAQGYPDKRVCVLNFASACNPGGGVVSGATAQEECLCRISTLYPCLNTKYNRDNFYMPHRSLDSLYNADMIYTPDVTVFKTDTKSPVMLESAEWFHVDVITCAAPNLKRYKGRIKNAEIQAVFQERLERIIRLALNYNCEVLILGAFGCGAFGNSPSTVALASYKVLEKYRYCFDTIEFAIYCSDRDTGNYDAFKFIERRMKER